MKVVVPNIKRDVIVKACDGMYSTELSDLLRRLRSISGKTQDQVANSCGISKIALARYETGTRIPRAEIMNKLASFYGVSIDYLMGRDDVPYRNDRRDSVDSITAMLSTMTEEEKEQVLQYVRFILRDKK